MLFRTPYILLLLIPLTGVIAALAYYQFKALIFLKKNTHRRGLKKITSYGVATLTLHLLLLAAMGVSLVVIAAGPYDPAAPRLKGEKPQMIFMIDASFSMLADDVKLYQNGRLKKYTRFNAVKGIAPDLIKYYPEAEIGLLTFSGTATLHSPPSSDHRAISEQIRVLNPEAYSSSGSDFSNAFSSLFHLIRDSERGPVVVFFSDGEIPHEIGNYEESIELLAQNNVTIVTVGIGSSNKTYHEIKIKSGNDKKSTTIAFSTARDDERLEQIAEGTGGRYYPVNDWDDYNMLRDSLSDFLPEEDNSAEGQKSHDTDLSLKFSLFFLLLLAVDRLLLQLKSRNKFLEPVDTLLTEAYLKIKPVVIKITQNLKQIKWLLPLIVLPVFNRCESDIYKAYHANKDGAAALEAGQLQKSRADFERSVAYRFRDHIPYHNLGLVALEQKAYPLAHRIFENSLKKEPDLIEALYHDGITLYRWADTEMDNSETVEKSEKPETEKAGVGEKPLKCISERAETLLKQAVERFNEVVDRSSDNRLAEKAYKNAEVIRKFLRNPPEKCDGASGGGGSGNENNENKDEGNPPEDDENNEEENNNSGGSQGPGGGQNGVNNSEGNNGGDPPPAGLTEEEEKQVKKRLEQIQGSIKPGRQYNQTQSGRGNKTENGPGGGTKIWW